MPRPVLSFITRQHRMHSAAAAVLPALLAVTGTVLAASPPAGHPGLAIYQQHCTQCHGDRGQGVEGEYEESLHGDRTIKSLARRIERTMPEDEPELVDGEDARLVAEWMHATFYWAEARAPLAPPSTDLTRLTVEQHRRSLIDLIDRLHDEAPEDPAGRRGLKAAYFANRHFGSDGKKKGTGHFERIEPIIQFDSDDQSPSVDFIGKKEFSIRWQGVVIPEDTGVHKFIVRTKNGARLYINDTETPLIDGWVSTGREDRDEKGSIHLLAGRPYALKLEFFSSKDPAASVALRWQPPHGVEETVPGRVLAPTRSPVTLVLDTPFPPDDSSDGYPRGHTISADWYRATVEAATTAAHFMVANADRLARTTEAAEDRADRWRELASKLTAAAFRRPLDKAHQREFIDEVFAAYAVKSDLGHRAFLRALFHHLVKQPVEAYGIDRLDMLHNRFQSTGFNIVDAIETIALIAAKQANPR